MMVTLLWIAFGLIMSIGLASAILALLRAGDGYEDEQGFHCGAPLIETRMSRVRVKRTRRNRWTSVRARSDH